MSFGLLVLVAALQLAAWLYEDWQRRTPKMRRR
jgi:hypothetical protein